MRSLDVNENFASDSLQRQWKQICSDPDSSFVTLDRNQTDRQLPAGWRST